MIDQFYCDGGKCSKKSSAVSVSKINYVDIKGTYAKNPVVHFTCSDNLPCTGVSLDTTELNSDGEDSQPFCWNAYRELESTTAPPINCLQSGNQESPLLIAEFSLDIHTYSYMHDINLHTHIEGCSRHAWIAQFLFWKNIQHHYSVIYEFIVHTYITSHHFSSLKTVKLNVIFKHIVLPWGFFDSQDIYN